MTMLNDNAELLMDSGEPDDWDRSLILAADSIWLFEIKYLTQ